jgi:hypothetical protein
MENSFSVLFIALSKSISTWLAGFVWEFEVCERCVFERSESRCVTRAKKKTYRPKATNKGLYIICTIVPVCIWLAKTIPWKKGMSWQKKRKRRGATGCYNTNSLFVFDKKQKLEKEKRNPEWKRTPSSPFKKTSAEGDWCIYEAGWKKKKIRNRLSVASCLLALGQCLQSPKIPWAKKGKTRTNKTTLMNRRWRIATSKRKVDNMVHSGWKDPSLQVRPKEKLAGGSHSRRWH